MQNSVEKRAVKWQTHLILVCWITYVCAYLGRLNYTAAMADMVAQGVVSKVQAGTIATGYFITYGGGQLFSGILGDRCSPRRLVCTGLIGSALCNVCMACRVPFFAMLAAWVCNGALQSLVWAPLVKLLSRYLPPERCASACIHLATTTAAGTLMAYGLGALCVSVWNWQMVFWISAVLVTLGAGYWMSATAPLAHRPAQPKESMPAAGAAQGQPYDDTSLRKTLWPSGLVYVLAAVMIQGVLKDGVATWVPTYLTETFGFGASVSILASTALPVVNVFGVYLANSAHRRYLHDELSTSAVAFFCAVGALGMLLCWGLRMASLAVAALALCTTAMLGVNAMLISLLPLYFAKRGKVATVTGMMNAMAYVGSAVSSYGIGALSTACGWTATVCLWEILAVLGGVLSLVARRPWNAYRRTL